MRFANPWKSNRPAAVRAQPGFTLLELILALAITGVVVLIAMGAFHVGRRAWEKGDAVADANQRLRIAVERIRQQLSAATLYTGTGEEAFVGFAGDAGEIRFVSRVSLVPDQERGLVFVHYRFVETDDQDLVLLFYEQPVVALSATPSDETTGKVTYRPLLVGLEDAAWQYRASAAGGNDDAWKDHWSGREDLGLPTAVRLLVRAGQDPPLAVVIRVINPWGA